MRTPLALVLIALLAAAVLPGRPARAAGPARPAPTYFLVAQPDLPDPMFSQSVVLMLPPTGTELVVGLIVNKPTKIKLGDLFPDDAALKKRTDPAYFGGPVAINAPLMLVQGSHPPRDSVPLFKDIYLALKPRSIRKILKDAKPPPGMRLYLGRAQWTDEQLHNEMLENSWYKVPSDPQDVFSSDPGAVWRNLVARAQAIETSAPAPPAFGVPPALLRVTWPSPPALDETAVDR